MSCSVLRRCTTTPTHNEPLMRWCACPGSADESCSSTSWHRTPRSARCTTRCSACSIRRTCAHFSNPNSRKLVPGGIDALAYAATSTIRLPVDIAFTEQSESDAVLDILRADL